MAKVSFLLPDEEMMVPVIEAANEYHLDVLSLSVADKDNTVRLAELAQKNGADILVSRGTSALIAAKITGLPVIEIKLMLFDLELLIEQAKKLVSKERPFIGLTGAENIFASFDENFFSARHGVRFKAYLHNTPGSSASTAIQAVSDGADVIIGGPGPGEYCREHGIPFVRTAFGREGIREACRNAQMMAAVIDRDRSHFRQMDMIMDHVGSGFVQIDCEGRILFANSFVEHLLGMGADRLRGQSAWQIFPRIEKETRNFVLRDQKEIPALPVTVGNGSFVLSISPVLVNGKTESAVIWLYEGIQSDRREHAARLKLLRYSPVDEDNSFRTLIARSGQSRQTVKTAEHYAKFRLPVLITGPMGTEKQTVAECIHNASQLCGFPFIRFNCGSDPEKNLKQMLSGSFPVVPGGEPVAYRGPFTLYLHEISALSWAMQYQIVNLLQQQAVRADGENSRGIRVIASSREDLAPRVADGTFRCELFYCLNVAVLRLLPFALRSEDVMGWMDYYLAKYQNYYGRYIRLKGDAQKFLKSYPWPGNLTEMRALCQRLLVNCESYYIGAEDIQKQLAVLSVGRSADGSAEAPRGKAAPNRAAELRRLLSLYGGNREAVAAELGVSTTTLWRWMKKEQIDRSEGKA